MSRREARSGVVGAVLACAALAIPGVAGAQPMAPPAERHGVFGGGGLFGGNISCDGADCGGFREAGGLSGHVGWMFGPRLGVMVDVWAMTSSKNDVAITYVAGTLNLRYWLANALWIQGGLGNGHAVITYRGLAARGDDVPVGQLAIGFEVVRGRTWSIDVAGKVAQGGSTDDAGNVTTGRSAGIGAHLTLFAMR